MAVFDPLVLISIGIALIALEAVVASFNIVWFGLASIIIGISGYFINYETMTIQLIAIFILSMLSMLLLRNKVVKKFIKPPEPQEDFYNTEGTGVIKEGKVYYKGTLFSIEPDEEKFSENERVHILKIHMNKATIQKIK